MRPDQEETRRRPPHTRDGDPVPVDEMFRRPAQERFREFPPSSDPHGSRRERHKDQERPR